jgi:hypothetical protein
MLIQLSLLLGFIIALKIKSYYLMLNNNDLILHFILLLSISFIHYYHNQNQN